MDLRKDDYTLKIGDPIVSKNPCDMYELKVKYMSGDADAYETETFEFKDLDHQDEPGEFTLNNALTIILAYKAAAKSKWNSLCGISSSKLHEILEIDEAIVDAADCCGFFPGDVTCDHQFMAMIDSYELFYWDVNGIKHRVTVEQS